MNVNDLIERPRSVKWEVTADCDRMPDDPTHKCVFVDMRPDDFRALLREAADALEAAREDARVLRRGNERLAEALQDAAKSMQTIADKAGRDEYLMTMDEVRGYANSRANAARAALEQEDGSD
jgi:hypothetical protein